MRRRSQIANVYYNMFTFQAKLLTLPQVFITPEIDPRLAVKLKDIVKRHNVRIHDICKCIDIHVLHIGSLTKQEVKMSSSEVQSWPTCIFMQNSKPISAMFTKVWWISGLFACISDNKYYYVSSKSTLNWFQKCCILCMTYNYRYIHVRVCNHVYL